MNWSDGIEHNTATGRMPVAVGHETDRLIARLIGLELQDILGSGGVVDPHGNYHPSRFSPSTDEADADRVASFLGSVYGLRFRQEHDPKTGECHAYFGTGTGSSFLLQAAGTADTMPLAICRAALEWADSRR